MRKVTAGDPITVAELRQMLGTRFTDLVKGVVDLRRNVLIVDAACGPGGRALAEGSAQSDLW